MRHLHRSVNSVLEIAGGLICLDGIPAHAVPGVTEIMEAHAWVLPSWMERVWVVWQVETPDSGASMTCVVNYARRWMKIVIYASWVGESKETREENVLHEFLHASINPLADYAEEVVESVSADPYKDILVREIYGRCESAVTDLSRSILKRERSAHRKEDALVEAVARSFDGVFLRN